MLIIKPHGLPLGIPFKPPTSVAINTAQVTSNNPNSNLVAPLTPAQQAALNYQDGDCTTLEAYCPAPQCGTIGYGETVAARSAKLYRLGGNWHLLDGNDPNPPTCKRTWQTTWRDIAEQPLYNNDPIYVGPTPIDQESITTPGDAPSELTTLTNPAELPKAWISIIREMLDTFLKATKGKSGDFSSFVNTYTGNSSLQMPYPDTARRIAIMSAADPVLKLVQSSECGSTAPQRCIAKQPEFAYGFNPASQTQTQAQTYLQKAGVPGTAWDGSLYTDSDGAQWWHGKDSNGNPVTYVKHPKGVSTSPGSYNGQADSNVYQVYTLYDWATYLGLDLPETLALAYLEGYLEEQTTNLQSVWLGTRDIGGGSNIVPTTRPPLAKWDNPAEVDTSQNPWGYWIILSELNQLTGLWDTDRDRPGQFYMFVMYSRIPQCDWWCEIVKAIEWVCSLLVDVLAVVAGTTENLLNLLICNGSPQQIAQLTKGGAAATGATVAYKLIACPPAIPIDCTNPINATNPACPQGTQIPWFVWAGGALLLVLVLSSAAKSKPAEQKEAAP